jgi:DNA replicative helicase MCM subunit Mcm2 (Cdc46/Mcm family)
VARARQKRPTVPPHVSSYIVDSYVRLRKQSKDESNKTHTYTSARTLLGVLRLAQALARLRLADEVQQPDVDEALRLMECSKDSLQDEDEDAQEHDRSAASQIYRLVRGMLTRKTKPMPKRFGKGPGRERDMDVDSDEEEETDTLSMVDVRARVLNAGWTEAQLMDCITGVSESQYSFMNALLISCLSTKISKSGLALPMVPSCRSSVGTEQEVFAYPLSEPLSSLRLTLSLSLPLVIVYVD